MALKEVVVPKRYKNGDPLFERSLDVWRLAVVELLQDVQKNFTQLRKDCFFPSYDYDNDGNANLGQSLQTQINLLSSGGSPLTGTSSSTFSINTGGFAVTLDTLLLTANRTVYFPDGDGTFVYEDLTQTLTNKTLTSPTITGATFTGDITFGTNLLFIDDANNKVLVGSTSSASTDLFQVIKNSSGASVSSLVRNTSNTSSSIAEHIISSGGSSAGDATQTFNISGVSSFTNGINNSVTGDPLEWAFAGSLTDDQYQMQLFSGGSGAATKLTVFNHNNTSSSSSQIDVVVGGATAADATVTTRVSGAGAWTSGSNNSQSDYWELINGTALVDNQYLLQARQGGSGAQNLFQIFNHNNTSSSDSVFDCVVGGTSGGDAVYRARINGGADWTWGLDNSAVDSWKLQFSTTLTDDFLAQGVQGGSGAANYWYVQNSNNTASSHAYVYVAVGGTSGGDPGFAWLVPGGTSWIAGPDNSDNDTWKLCTGSAIGTNSLFEVTSDGDVFITGGTLDLTDSGSGVSRVGLDITASGTGGTNGTGIIISASTGSGTATGISLSSTGGTSTAIGMTMSVGNTGAATATAISITTTATGTTNGYAFEFLGEERSVSGTAGTLVEKIRVNTAGGARFMYLYSS